MPTNSSLAWTGASASVNTRQIADKTDAKPFLKWAGGKRSLLPRLRKRMPVEYGRYFEPFIGGGALFFDTLPEDAVLSDVNRRLVRTYRTVRDDVYGLIDRLEIHQRSHGKDYYYEQRARDIDVDSDLEVAAWFVYLNKTAFNGLYRVNKKNGFNVPFGKYKNPNICPVERLLACNAALQGVSIEVADFAHVLESAEAGDFVYFDPPYVPLSASSNFTAYAKAGFGHDAQVRLRDLAVTLKERGVHVLLSNSWTPIVRELYSADFELERVQVKRPINSRASKRGAVGEALIR